MTLTVPFGGSLTVAVLTLRAIAASSTSEALSSRLPVADVRLGSVEPPLVSSTSSRVLPVAFWDSPASVGASLTGTR